MDLEQVWRRARRAIRGVTRHLEAAHNAYVADWPHDAELIAEADKTYQALSWKLLPISYHLEMLWVLVEMKDDVAGILHDSGVAPTEWRRLEHDLGLLTLESVLFQFRAFLDLHMRYSLLLLGLSPPLKMKRRHFRRALSRLGESSKGKALDAYYSDQVWADDQWGSLLLSLRDKIAHQDRLYPRPSAEHVELNLPVPALTVAGRKLERLAEDLSNGMIGLLQDTTPILTGQPWSTE